MALKAVHRSNGMIALVDDGNEGVMVEVTAPRTARRTGDTTAEPKQPEVTQDDDEDKEIEIHLAPLPPPPLPLGIIIAGKIGAGSALGRRSFQLQLDAAIKNGRFSPKIAQQL